MGEEAVLFCQRIVDVRFKTRDANFKCLVPSGGSRMSLALISFHACITASLALIRCLRVMLLLSFDI